MKTFTLIEVEAPEGEVYTLQVRKVGFYTVSCEFSWVIGGGF